MNFRPAIFLSAVFPVIAAIVTGPAAADATVVKTEEAFRSIVVDKPLHNSQCDEIIVHADGTWDGRCNFGAVTRGTGGAWKFEDGYFCRTVTHGTSDCQVIEVDPPTVTFIRQRGTGKRAVYEFQ